jgi:hypothetical protein
VFLPTGDFWYYWNIFILLFATIDLILYPYYTAQGFPNDIYHPGCILIYISSLIFFFDLILNFFVAQKVEGDESDYVMHIEKIGLKYIYGKFIFDFIVLLPLGMLGSLYSRKLYLLHLIKVERVNRFVRFFKPSFYMP